jgi:cell division protein FtsI (penicillin-binding protein 3)
VGGSGKGYGEGIVASFVGLVPAEKPEFIFMVTVDEPTPVTYGGIVAAPAVRDIAIKTLSYYGRLPEGKGAPDANATEHSMTARATHSPTADGSGATVPNLVGLSVRRALEVLGKRGVVPSLKGGGMEITNQKPAPGEPWPEGGVAAHGEGFVLWLGHGEKEKTQ